MDVRGYIGENSRPASSARSGNGWRSRRSRPTRRATPTSGASADWLAGHLRRDRLPGRGDLGAAADRAARAARGLRRVARRGPGRSRRARLRPPRRAAGRTAGGVDSPPFQPAERDGQLLGPRRLRRQGPRAVPRTWPRGPARRPAAATAPPVTLKLLIEGEEESGSPNFADLLRPSGTGWMRRDRGQPTPRCGRRTSRRCAPACGADRRRDRR